MATFSSNLIPNPGAETNVNGWFTSGATLDRVTSPVAEGNGSFRATATATGQTFIRAADIGLAPGGLEVGKLARIQGRVSTTNNPRSVQIWIEWYGPSGFISASSTSAQTSVVGSFITLSIEAVVPAGADRGSFQARTMNSQVGDVTIWDSFLLAAEVELAPTPTASGPTILRREGASWVRRKLLRRESGAWVW